MRNVKKDTMWIKWVNEMYLQELEWWDYKPPQGCSWVWKKIREIKEELKGMMTLNKLVQMGKYSVNKIMHIKTTEFAHVNWDKYFWNRLTILKIDFFFFGLLCSTGSRPLVDFIRWELLEMKCRICDEAEETRSIYYLLIDLVTMS